MNENRTTESTSTPIRPSRIPSDHATATSPQATPTHSHREDRIMGTLVGQAVADALGSPYELNGRRSFGRAQFGRGTFGHGVAQWTDDTEQAVIVAQARSDPAKIAEGLLEWLTIAKDVGHQTRRILSRVRSYHGMVLASRAYARQQALKRMPDPGTGTGGIMRVGPVALPFLGDREKIADAARRVTALTHASAWDQDGAMLWALAIDRAIELGEDFRPAMVADGLDLIPEQRRHFWASVIMEALSGPVPSPVNGSGVACFRSALYAVSHAESYEQAVQGAIQLGGDTDTVGAVAGALAGARYGVLEIPPRWAERVWGWPGYDGHRLAELALASAGDIPLRSVKRKPGVLPV